MNWRLTSMRRGGKTSSMRLLGIAVLLAACLLCGYLLLTASPSAATLTSAPPTYATFRERLGRGAWYLLHAIAASQPDQLEPREQQKLAQFLELFAHFYPCARCREHFQELLQKDNVEAAVVGRRELEQWTCKVHNEVNVQLNKRTFDCSPASLEVAYSIACDGCIQQSIDLSNATDDAQLSRQLVVKNDDYLACGARWDKVKWIRRTTSLDLFSDDLGSTKGFTVLLFWKLSCPVCKPELERLQQSYASWRDKSVNILAIASFSEQLQSEQANIDAIQAYITSKGIEYNVGLQDDALTDSIYKHFLGAQLKGVPIAVLVHRCSTQKLFGGWDIGKNLYDLIDGVIVKGTELPIF